MTEEYLRTLRKQLKGFSREEQELLIEEISSHIQSGEEDSQKGKDPEQRRNKMISELGSPKDLGKNFQEIYHPNRLIDYLLILIPYFFYPYLNSLYTELMPKFGWADVRLDIIIHLPLVALGLWRRSAALTLFWLTIIVSQLFIITLQIDWYYGIQTVLWALLLLALLALAGYLIWKYRNDLLIVAFGLVSLSLCLLGSFISILGVADYSVGLVGQSLLLIYSHLSNMIFYALMLALALFFLPANRQLRWLALLIYGLVTGMSLSYLNDVFAEWVFVLWVILPCVITFFGWWLERTQKQKMELASS